MIAQFNEDLVVSDDDDEPFEFGGLEINLEPIKPSNVVIPSIEVPPEVPPAIIITYELKDGRGIYIDTKAGELYEGEWKNDKKNGRGRLLSRDGRQYIGEFKDD